MRIGGSVFLLAVGAILAWAVDIDPYAIAGVTIDWAVIGYILMAAGVLGLVWTLVVMEQMRNRDRERARAVAYGDDPRRLPEDPVV